MAFPLHAEVLYFKTYARACYAGVDFGSFPGCSGHAFRGFGVAAEILVRTRKASPENRPQVSPIPALRSRRQSCAIHGPLFSKGLKLAAQQRCSLEPRNHGPSAHQVDLFTPFRIRKLWVPHISQSEMWEGYRTAVGSPDETAGVLNTFQPDRQGRSGSSLPHLASRDMGHPQFLVRRRRMFFDRVLA